MKKTMKKTILIFVAIALAVSCKVEEILQDEIITSTAEGGYSFDFSVNGGGFGAETKADATVGWTRGESIFVFFQPEGEALLDSYLSLTYDGSKFVQGGSSVRIGTLGEGGKLSAVYVPYLKSGVKPVYSEGSWTINAGDVYYSCATEVCYTVEDSNVSATIDMHIPDGYVQFAVLTTKADEGDELSCNMVDAYNCVTLGSDLKFTEVAVEGKKMSGHKDGGKVYFWGKMNDTSAEKCVLTLSSSITGGDLVKIVPSASLSTNNAYNTVFLLPDALPGAFSISSTKKVHFSKGNLYCTDNGESASPRYTFDFEDKQYEFHLRPYINLLEVENPDFSWTIGTTYDKSSDIAFLRKIKDPALINAVKGLKCGENMSGLFQWVSENNLVLQDNLDWYKEWFIDYRQVDSSGVSDITGEEEIQDFLNNVFVIHNVKFGLNGRELFNEHFILARECFGAFSYHSRLSEYTFFWDGLRTDEVDFGKAFGPNSQWFTPSQAEWSFLIGYNSTTGECDNKSGRPNATKLCNSHVVVNGVSGMLLAPDDWDFTNTPIVGNGAKTNYDGAEWDDAEASGLVFLPAIAYQKNKKYADNVRYGFDQERCAVEVRLTEGTYWTRSTDYSFTASNMKFSKSVQTDESQQFLGLSEQVGMYNKDVRFKMNPVRLVCY